MYDGFTSPHVCGDCRDMMMRSPVCAQRIAEDECGCADTTDCGWNAADVNDCGTADEYSDTPLAMVSSPYQGFGDVYECPCEALKHGTLFRLLDLPILTAPGPRCKGGHNG